MYKMSSWQYDIWISIFYIEQIHLYNTKLSLQFYLTLPVIWVFVSSNYRSCQKKINPYCKRVVTELSAFKEIIIQNIVNGLMQHKFLYGLKRLKVCHVSPYFFYFLLIVIICNFDNFYDLKFRTSIFFYLLNLGLAMDSNNHIY